MEGRHLVFAYATVILIQVGYFLWTALGFRRVQQQEKELADEKATKPV
jgi:hypothetical protein